MRHRGLLVLAGFLFSGCVMDATPPVRDPVVHDLMLRYTSWEDDYDASGMKKTYPMSTSLSGSLLIDLHTEGGRLEVVATPSCFAPEGRVVVGGGVVNGRFEVSEEGPRLTMSGTVDSVGMMTGTFECRDRFVGPHYRRYMGDFTATPRR